MGKSYLDSSENNPDDVHDNGEASSVICSWNYLTSKWVEGKAGNLKELNSEWYADDSYAKCQTHENIIKADE